MSLFARSGYHGSEEIGGEGSNTIGNNGVNVGKGGDGCGNCISASFSVTVKSFMWQVFRLISESILVSLEGAEYRGRLLIY